MEAQRVDPRSATWEDYHPTYRVYFGATPCPPNEYEPTDASHVQEVMRWAEDNRNGQVGIAWLSGTDPTRSE